MKSLPSSLPGDGFLFLGDLGLVETNLATIGGVVLREPKPTLRRRF